MWVIILYRVVRMIWYWFLLTAVCLLSMTFSFAVELHLFLCVRYVGCVAYKWVRSEGRVVQRLLMLQRHWFFPKQGNSNNSYLVPRERKYVYFFSKKSVLLGNLITWQCIVHTLKVKKWMLGLINISFLLVLHSAMSCSVQSCCWVGVWKNNVFFPRYIGPEKCWYFAVFLNLNTAVVFGFRIFQDSIFLNSYYIQRGPLHSIILNGEYIVGWGSAFRVRGTKFTA